MCAGEFVATMQKDERLPDLRPVYSMGVAVQPMQMHPQSLRLYDKEGLLLPARRRQWRFYSPHDLDRIRIMRHLVHQEDVGLKGLRRMLGLIPCWDLNGCPPKRSEKCRGATVRSRPC